MVNLFTRLASIRIINIVPAEDWHPAMSLVDGEHVTSDGDGDAGRGR